MGRESEGVGREREIFETVSLKSAFSENFRQNDAKPRELNVCSRVESDLKFFTLVNASYLGSIGNYNVIFDRFVK